MSLIKKKIESAEEHVEKELDIHSLKEEGLIKNIKKHFMI